MIAPVSPRRAYQVYDLRTVVAAARSSADAFDARPAALPVILDPPEAPPNDRDRLIESTRDLRDLATLGRALRDQLEVTPKDDPAYEHLRLQLSEVDRQLSEKYGYVTATAPRPGTLFIDPQFEGESLPNGQVTSGQFPVRPPVLAPPSAIDALFGGGGPVETRDDDGTVASFQNPDEYRAFIARNRKAAGIAPEGGEPIGAQFVFQGGGGKGKRFAPVMIQMVNQGVVPVSVSGTSAGAVAAAFLAAGADPLDVERLVRDPMLAKLLGELGLAGGVNDGKALYDHIDRVLRELTGITDRPVTFGDLRIPLQVLATRMYDSAETGSMTTVESRKFVFSQETTPNTPVALAVRASVAIPGAFDPIQMVDPMTGREVMLVDGGVLDNLPMGIGHGGLPVVGLSLQDPNENHPQEPRNLRTPRPLQAGNIDVSSVLANAGAGRRMYEAAGGSGDDFRNRAQPQPGTFMFGVPCWNLDDPSKADTVMKFEYDPAIDPELDVQSAELTRRFLRENLASFSTTNAKGTNAFTSVPSPLRFSREVSVGGRAYRAVYNGGDVVTLQPRGQGEPIPLGLGRRKIEAMWLDDCVYGDLIGKLQLAAAPPDSTPSLTLK